MRSLVGFVIVIAIGGCWTQAAVAPVAPGTVEPSATFAAVRARDQRVATREVPPRIPRQSMWTGTYTCTQGLTGVTLIIDVTGSDAEAVFEFFPVPQNPTPVKSGATRIKGTMTELADGGFALDLDPDSWINQPGGYTMVGMAITIDSRHRELHGTIKSNQCGAIDALRVDR